MVTSCTQFNFVPNQDQSSEILNHYPLLSTKSSRSTLKFLYELTPKDLFHPQLSMKYQTENWQGIVFFSHGQMKRSLVLVGNHLEIVSR